MPSAPITRSKRRGGEVRNRTSTPSPVSVRAVTVSPKTYSTSSRVRSYSTWARSPRAISTSPLKNSDGISTIARPAPSTKVWVPMPVCRARIASVMPIRSSSSICAPRKSTPCPPVRRAGACSTTVTAAPRRASQ
jgi:hypothetical protein